jgi:hypothetical protein
LTWENARPFSRQFISENEIEFGSYSGGLGGVCSTYVKGIK